MKYSVVIPARNEETNLPTLLEELAGVMRGLGEEWEAIVVDDGSVDGTIDVLRRAADAMPTLRVVSLDCSHGQSAALDAGFRAAVGEIVITMDADLQNDPADIPAMLARLEDVDAVIGIRRDRRDPLVKRLASSFANAVRRRELGDTYEDIGCPLRVIRRSALLKVKLFRGMHRFIPVLLELEGCRVGQMDVRHRARGGGKTKYGVFDRLVETVPDMLAVRWMRSRALRYKVRDRF